LMMEPQGLYSHRSTASLTGKVVADFGVCSIEAQKVIKVGYKQRRYANL